MHQGDPKPVADIWLTRLDMVSKLQRASYHALLSNDEKARYARYVAPDAAEQFLVARALLRITLSRYYQTAPHNWQFGTSRYGKPFIQHPESSHKLSFNISHTRGLVACVVSETACVGIDVEDLSRQLEFRSLAQHSFSPQEAATLSDLSSPELADQFYTFWTLKEAYIKARGMGLSIPLNSFWFSTVRQPIEIHFSPGAGQNPESWHFVACHLNHSYRLAIAAESPDGRAMTTRLHWTVPDASNRQLLPEQGIPII